MLAIVNMVALSMHVFPFFTNKCEPTVVISLIMLNNIVRSTLLFSHC